MHDFFSSIFDDGGKSVVGRKIMKRKMFVIFYILFFF